jgi:hypothetical protein
MASLPYALVFATGRFRADTRASCAHVLVDLIERNEFVEETFNRLVDDSDTHNVADFVRSRN